MFNCLCINDLFALQRYKNFWTFLLFSLCFKALSTIYLQVGNFSNVNPFWHNVRNSTIALAIWGLIIAAAFYFTKEKKRKRKKRKEEDTPLTKEDKKESFRFALIFWPIIAIAIICIVMYIVELAMGYNATSPDSEILYKLGALDSYKIYEDQSWWHLLAYAFLHSSVHHLLGNVFSLLFTQLSQVNNPRHIGA